MARRDRVDHDFDLPFFLLYTKLIDLNAILMGEALLVYPVDSQYNTTG